MLSLHRKQNDVIKINDVEYPIDFNFNVVLANMELSQNTDISDVTKLRTYLINYLDIDKEDLNKWSINEQQQIYMMITLKLLGDDTKRYSPQQNKKDDKSAYSFVEDADFIYASFLKDYNIDLIKRRNNLHWNEFKALFVSLSEDTKMVQVMRIRQWTKKDTDTKEYVNQMRELQRVYALKTTQEELEVVDLERQKMASMTADERVEYAKQRLKEIEKGG